MKKVDEKYVMRPIQKKVLFHWVLTQRLFLIIFIADVERAEKLEKSLNLVHLEEMCIFFSLFLEIVCKNKL